jgi:hypothetical protein
MSKNIVCTLFEKGYYTGVGALVNSLYFNGFRGDFYVGYKGDLGGWTSKATYNNTIKWKEAKSLVIKDDFIIHFLPFTSENHLTNCKAEFMLRLIDLNELTDESGIFYFDPDIVIKCSWSFFEHWITCGIAVVHEITANDMPFNSPTRVSWQRILQNEGYEIRNQINSYINAGFLGLKVNYKELLNTIVNLTHIAKEKYSVDLINFNFTTRLDPFFAKDQDILNMALMSCSFPLSEMGPEAMDFIHGGFTMSHAIGSPKPWNKNIFFEFVKGSIPTMADKSFFNYANGAIELFDKFTLKRKRYLIKLTSFLSRFYSK